MQKHSVNLIIKRSNEPPIITKLKVILPIAAVVSLTLFVIFFFSSIIYISRNNQEFNSLKTQITNLEKLISAAKNTEGIYTLTVSRVKTIDQLNSTHKNYFNLLTEIKKLQLSGINLTQVTIDKKNAVVLAVSASSSASLDNFVTTLENRDISKVFSDIKSSGIVKDKTGSYLLSISLKPNPGLLQ